MKILSNAEALETVHMYVYGIKSNICFTCGNPSEFDECHFCMIQREKGEAHALQNRRQSNNKHLSWAV